MGIGQRLKEERDRLGYNQTEFAALGGAAKNSQYNYEKGERSPDSEYLAAIAKAGADVLYIVTGERTPRITGELSVDEVELLSSYRVISEDDRKSLSKLARALVAYN